MHQVDYIASIIKSIRESRKDNGFYYQNGGCFEFYKILKSIFPTTQPFWVKYPDHVGALINGTLYDINGKVGGLMEEKEIEKARNWKEWGEKRLKDLNQ